jgi:hypothetical protein
MGLKIVGSNFFEELGISLTDSIVTLNGSVQLTKLNGPQRTNNLPYRVRGEYTIWASENAYAEQYNQFSSFKPILRSITIYLDLDDDQIKGDLLGILYNKLKERYPSAIDC